MISQHLLRRRGTKTTEQLTFSDGCETLIKSNLLSPVWRGLLQKNQIHEGGKIDQRISQLDLKCSQMGAKGWEQRRGNASSYFSLFPRLPVLSLHRRSAEMCRSQQQLSGRELTFKASRALSCNSFIRLLSIIGNFYVNLLRVAI